MKDFITFRRHHIDTMLSQTSFYGRVLDIGGKKDKKRGWFRPPLDQVEYWKYLNMDPLTDPDYCCSADAIPVQDETFDMIVLTEVIEHLENPQKVLRECHRVLCRGGRLVGTIPFLYMVHPDPHDYQRWTPEGILREFTQAGFKVEQMQAMGSLFAVIYDLIRNSLGFASKNSRASKNIFIMRYIMPALAHISFYLDRKYEYKNQWVTTGYYVIAQKQT